MATLGTSIPIDAKDLWVDLPPLNLARQEIGVAALDGKVYVIGGILAARVTTGFVQRFNIESNAWEDVDPLPENTQLHHLGAAAVAGKIYSIGGLSNNFTGSSDVFAYDQVTENWDRVASLPRARGAMGVAVLDGKICAAGGQSGSTDFAYLAVYHPEPEDRWEKLSDMDFERNHLAGAAVGGIFYAISGRNGGLQGTVEAYDPVTHAWVEDRAPLFSAIQLATSPKKDGLLEAHEILNLDLKGKWILLSGCETTTGPLRQGEGLESLARTFLLAGAKGAVGSLWRVDDASALLMERFYMGLRSGQTPAVALRHAKLDLLHRQQGKSFYPFLIIQQKKIRH